MSTSELSIIWSGSLQYKHVSLYNDAIFEDELTLHTHNKFVF